MDKFVYKEGEMRIARTQCEFCKYNKKETPESCEKYLKKPDEILANQKKCPMARNNRPAPWDK